MKQHRAQACAWKKSLPASAQPPGQYGRSAYDFCLPVEAAQLNLLAPVRETALQMFRDLEISWHRGIDGGPTNHLLSSQVQCVNALGAMVHDPARIIRAFGSQLDIAEVLEIEPGRFLTFEFVPATDYLSEGGGGVLSRGAHSTSVDAAFLYRTPASETELALVEWKFTEAYSTPHDPVKDRTRLKRYGHLLDTADSPIRSIPFEWMLDEPFYQLMRQQLLAHVLESDPATPYSAARVLHVLDPGNAAYQASIVNPNLKALGATVDEIWASLVRVPDRFRHIDPGVFRDPLVTGKEYVARYSPST